LREEVKKQTELGKKVEGSVKSQTLVDENIIWDLVVNTLRSEKASSKQYIIFEGFPRNVEQAQKLDKIIVLQKAISVRADQNVINQRLGKLNIKEQDAVTQSKAWLQTFEPLIN